MSIEVSAPAEFLNRVMWYSKGFLERYIKSRIDDACLDDDAGVAMVEYLMILYAIKKKGGI